MLAEVSGDQLLGGEAELNAVVAIGERFVGGVGNADLVGDDLSKQFVNQGTITLGCLGGDLVSQVQDCGVGRGRVAVVGKEVANAGE